MFESKRYGTFETITATEVTVLDAVRMMVEYEDAQDIPVPEIYISTAISSGGHYWNPEFRDESGKLDYGKSIPANNRAAALVASAIQEANPAFFNAANIMLPTELGKVYINKAEGRKWRDSDYMAFYLTWLSGLSVTGVAWVLEHFNKAPYESLLATMDNRKLPHEERWPSYQAFIEFICSKINLAGRLPKGRRSEASHTLVQLVDTQHSLGARAETLFAEVEGMHILSPLFNSVTMESVDETVAREIVKIRGFKAPEGTPPINVGCPNDVLLPLVGTSLP